MTDPWLLLVEDDPDLAALTVRVMRRNQVTADLLVCADGAEALSLLLGAAVPPRLVLMDLNLPKMNGLEVLRRLRSDDRTRLLPVVALTSSDEEQDLRAAYQSGVNSYVRKPVDAVQFTEAIRQLCQYWVTLNLTPPGR